MADCSHANSRKKYLGQSVVWQDVINQRLHGNDTLVKLMLESNLHDGKQKIGNDLSSLKYGVSITDECISWEPTEKLILGAHEKLLSHFQTDTKRDTADKKKRCSVA